MFEYIVGALLCVVALLAIPFLVLPVAIGYFKMLDSIRRPLGVIVGILIRRKQYPLFGNSNVVVSDACADDSRKKRRSQAVGEGVSGDG